MDYTGKVSWVKGVGERWKEMERSTVKSFTVKEFFPENVKEVQRFPVGRPSNGVYDVRNGSII